MIDSAATTATLTTEQDVNLRNISAQRPDMFKPALDAPKPEDGDFFWTYTEEPHRSRRQAIIKAHPEVRMLFT